MNHLRPVCLIAAVLMVVSCTKKPPAAAEGPHATVVMRDGTIYSGKVTSSSGDQMTLAGDDKNTYTLAMKNVRSVDYGDTTAANPAGAPPPEQVAASAPQPVEPQPVPPPQQPVQNAPVAPAPPPDYHPAEAQIQTRTWVVPTGTEVAVRLDETIDSERGSAGQTYAARITHDIRDADGGVVVPRGSNARVEIRSASRAGEFKGRADLVLGLDSVSVDGRRYALETNGIAERGREGLGKNKRTAAYTGGGAAFGAIIGAIAGHGKGAAIGALSGAAAGGATQVLTRGHAIHVPAETVLVFRLERPLRVVAR